MRIFSARDIVLPNWTWIWLLEGRVEETEVGVGDFDATMAEDSLVLLSGWEHFGFSNVANPLAGDITFDPSPYVNQQIEMGSDPKTLSESLPDQVGNQWVRFWQYHEEESEEGTFVNVARLISAGSFETLSASKTTLILAFYRLVPDEEDPYNLLPIWKRVRERSAALERLQRSNAPEAILFHERRLLNEYLRRLRDLVPELMELIPAFTSLPLGFEEIQAISDQILSRFPEEQRVELSPAVLGNSPILQGAREQIEIAIVLDSEEIRAESVQLKIGGSEKRTQKALEFVETVFGIIPAEIYTEAKKEQVFGLPPSLIDELVCEDIQDGEEILWCFVRTFMMVLPRFQKFIAEHGLTQLQEGESKFFDIV